MITLKAYEFEWINGVEDDPEDLCVHAKVDFKINDTEFVKPEQIWTASAAALYLLRTLEHNHSEESSVCESNYIFPCCAFSPVIVEGRFDLMFMGCCSGIDITVEHDADAVIIKSRDAKEKKVGAKDWQKAVVNFALDLKEFYSRSKPKHQLNDESERAGWLRFWEEFNDRLSYHQSKL